MSNVITTRIAEYDYSEFIELEAKHYLENLHGFLDRYEFYILEDLRQVGTLKPNEVTEEIINNVVWRDEHLPGDAWEQFEYDMTYFDKYSGETFHIEGTNMGWQNRSDEKVIDVVDGMDLFKAIEVNSDFNVRFWRDSDDKPGVYHARMSHHDSPTGENYEFTLKQ